MRMGRQSRLVVTGSGLLDSDFSSPSLISFTFVASLVQPFFSSLIQQHRVSNPDDQMDN